MPKIQAVKKDRITRFEKNLLESIRQAKRGEGRVARVDVTAATEARLKLGVSQSAFAQLLGVSVRTLQEWAQGRCEPSGTAKTLQWIKIQALLLLCSVTYCSASIASSIGDWLPPDQITFRDEVYKKNINKLNKEDTVVYEYITNDQSIENWNRLLSIIITRSKRQSLEEMAKLYSQIILSRKPLPRLKIYQVSNNLAIRIIYDFTTSENGFFESNVRLLRYSESCGSFIEISYAHKLSSNTPPEIQISTNEILMLELLQIPINAICIAK